MSHSSRISSYFTPVKKPQEHNDQPKVTVKNVFKSKNLPATTNPPFAKKGEYKPNGPFKFTMSNSSSGLSSFSRSSSSSTDNLAHSLEGIHVSSSATKPLRDLNMPTRKPNRIILSDDDDDDDNKQKENNDEQRTLRKKSLKSYVYKNLVSEGNGSSSSEDDDTAANMTKKDQSNMDIDNTMTTTSNSNNQNKRRRRMIQIDDSEDESTLIQDDDSNNSDVDEAYVDQNERLNDRYNALSDTDKIARLQKLHPTKTQEQISGALYASGNSAVHAAVMLMSEEPIPKRKKKGHLDFEQKARQQMSDFQTERFVLRFFNTSSSKEIQEITGCKPALANRLIEELRPFRDIEDLEEKLRATRGMGISYIRACEEMLKGYEAVDQIIEKVESIGDRLNKILEVWRGLGADSQQNSRQGSPDEEDDQPDEHAGTHLTHVKFDPSITISSSKNMLHKDALDGYLTEQPACVNKELTLKDYQVLGVNWMLLLYRKKISGILADEMGLGKTAQVITFLGRLKELGDNGPHLIVVPASTVENWIREFSRFCPGLVVRLFHGSQAEREEQKYDLIQDLGTYQVIVTTYHTACNSEERGLFKKLRCNSIILDEGHMIKNCTSQRYKNLMRIPTGFRLLLTGTPLQNNLQELVSLLIFVMPEMFQDNEEDIRNIFKIRTGTVSNNKSKKDSNDNTSSENHEENEQDSVKERAAQTAIQVLSKERVNRAKKMMTPFVLRRKKENVLKDLPKKSQTIDYCTMTANQAELYKDIITKTKKSYEASLDTQEKKKSASTPGMKAQFESMSNILIHLRKAADHPLLFRRVYTDELLRTMAKELKKDVQYWDSEEDLIFEDMSVMSDWELNDLCEDNKAIKHHALENNEWMDSGKVEKLKEILPIYKKEGNKVLIFSQFTKMLDILEVCMETIGVSYLRLDGSTPVMERQSLIDDFNESEDLDVFLLSTKAGGFGINLTSANIVVLYDLDFNPQNDKQAEDRAHRVGQTKDVTIIKLISKSSIEEVILKMANIKLRLDKRISATDEGGAGDDLDEDEAEEQTQSLHSMIKDAFMKADKIQSKGMK